MKIPRSGYNALLIILLPFSCLEAQTFQESESYVKSFPVNHETQVEVNNKYGKIYVKTWPKDSVKFEIDLNLSSNSLTRLQKVKNSIDFDFTSSKYYVTASTDFGNTSNQIYTELKNLSDALITGKNTIEINYTIYCPESVNITLINKFGNIYIDDLKGDININLSNGDLKINSITGKSRIELNFGNAIINKISDGNFAVSYADMKIKKAEKLSITSKSSTLNIEDTDVLKIDSRRDKYFINSLNSLNAISNFSQIWVEELKESGDLNLKFGTVTIDNITPEFFRINAISEYADINLYFNAKTEFESDIVHFKDVIVNLPSGNSNLVIKKESFSENEFYTNFRTKNSEDLPIVKIKALQKCYINLSIK